MEQQEAAPLVLVAEDEPDIAGLIDVALTRVGFVVKTVRDGVAALEAAERQPPDVIVLDVRMPRLDGIEACQRLRARKVLQEVPIIMLSALAQDVDAVRGLSAGASAYLVKPFSPQEIGKQVAQVLQQFRPGLALPRAAQRLIA